MVLKLHDLFWIINGPYGGLKSKKWQLITRLVSQNLCLCSILSRKTSLIYSRKFYIWEVNQFQIPNTINKAVSWDICKFLEECYFWVAISEFGCNISRKIFIMIYILLTCYLSMFYVIFITDSFLLFTSSIFFLTHHLKCLNLKPSLLQKETMDENIIWSFSFVTL